MNTNQVFYNEINQIRELFHKFGKFDDANAKLDEISKYLAIYVYQIQNNISDEKFLQNLVNRYENNNNLNLTLILKDVFNEVANSSLFLNTDNVSIFGNQPILNIDDNDNHFAYLLIKLVVNTVNSIIKNDATSNNFDLLNEVFGHFVRDNFRNHIEDAQYMTPSEVVDLMCDIALNDIKPDEIQNEFIVCDPSCGVGSFLSAFYQRNNEKKIIEKDKIKYLGQDKVLRMVRFSKINLILANNHNHIIANGNSLTGNSILNQYHGKVDLILTNPPFGAKFTSVELKEKVKQNYPHLHDVIIKNGNNFSSEILFIDRYIALLKPKGKLLVVLPDSVISSAGLNETLRFRLANYKNVTIKGIIELPAVTFAQAGTRTKTSILYLEKTEKTENFGVFMAKSDDIGFQVSNKKGATVKSIEGQNDLLKILDIYKTNNYRLNGENTKVINDAPSCVLVKSEYLVNNSWTPNHYHALKFNAFNGLQKKKSEINFIKLSDIVRFETLNRKKEYIPKDSKCISILHVNDDNLNLEELFIYDPKFHGTVCKKGDLLFSKINPRILRILVVPDLQIPLTCSTEFEIMNSTIELSNYAIKLLLMLPSVQNQIQSLTSGTSSSHNRIKTKDLSEVLIPLPVKNSELYNELLKKANEFEQSNISVNEMRFQMYNIKNQIFELIS